MHTRERHDYGAVTEGVQHPVPPAPHVSHDACDAPPEKVHPLHTIHAHDRNH
jgi:hypothetical protein